MGFKGKSVIVPCLVSTFLFINIWAIYPQFFHPYSVIDSTGEISYAVIAHIIHGFFRRRARSGSHISFEYLNLATLARSRSGNEDRDDHFEAVLDRLVKREFLRKCLGKDVLKPLSIGSLLKA